MLNVSSRGSAFTQLPALPSLHRCHFGRRSSASRMPSAPGFTAIGEQVTPEHDALLVDHEKCAFADTLLLAIGAVLPRNSAFRLEI